MRGLGREQWEEVDDDLSRITYKQSASSWARMLEMRSHPEALLAEEIGVTRPCPQTARHEATLRISLSPLDAGTGPVILVEHAGAFECLEGELLVVRYELGRNVRKCEGSENVVRGTQMRWLLESCDLHWDGEQEENDVLHEGYAHAMLVCTFLVICFATYQ